LAIAVSKDGSQNGVLTHSLDLEANVLGQYIPLHYHFQMLQDQRRLISFLQAIETYVKPGMHVVELGGGTGILSSFAARCGAKVTCVERNPQLVEFAKRTLHANGLGDSVTVVLEDAVHFVSNEPVDVVICEMLHVGLLREKQTSIISAFKENYQANWNEELPRFIPEATRLMVQLIEHPFDFEGYYAPLPIFQAPDQSANGDLRELSLLQDYGQIFYDEPIPESVRWRGTLKATASGFLSALRFVTLNFLAVESKGESPTWPNQFLIVPLPEPSSVVKGQETEIEFSYRYGASLEQLQESIHVRYQPVSF
jgi:type I protein arginine methyltransferase